MHNEFGSWVKTQRIIRCKLQKEVAEELGITPQTLVNVEKGNPVSIGTIRKIAKYFNYDVKKLMKMYSKGE